MKKAIFLFLAVSVFALSVPLSANQKKGANLIIQKKDGQKVKGELIAVKKASLLLLNEESGADMSIPVVQIRSIIVVKKANPRKYVGLGVPIVSGGGALVYSVFVAPEGSESGFYLIHAAVGAFFGLVAGLIIGEISDRIAGKDKIIQIEGKSDTEIQKILEKLRKKARVKNVQ